MKKILSLILVFAMAVSIFSGLTVFADDEEFKLLFEDNFDAEIMDLPTQWQLPNNDSYFKTNQYLQSKVAITGKALYVNDMDLKKSVFLYSPFFKAEPGQMYTGEMNVLAEEGYITIRLQFYDETQKNCLLSKNDSLNLKVWTTKTVRAIAPEGTAYVRIMVGTISNYTGVGYIDNCSIYKGIKWPIRDFNDAKVVQEDPVDAKLVAPSGDKLTYNSYNDKGDKFGDFSYAGFYAGQYEIPDSSNLPVATTISPSKSASSDDTERIQKVIDDVYLNSKNNYFKVIKLKAGRYNINKNGNNLKDGIVLSGEGQGPTGTVLYATDPSQYTVLKINGSDSKAIGDKHEILDAYIPSGSDKVTISANDIGNYKVGDLITVYSETTQEWVEMMDMVGVVNLDGQDASWKAGNRDWPTERYIKEINGNTITLDMPLYVPFDNEYLNGYIYKTSDAAKMQHVGIENLRLESYFSGDPEDENHANVAIAIANAKNCYVRDVSAKYFVVSTVSLSSGAKQITVKNCSNLEPVSTLAGSRRYSFTFGPGTQQCLVTGCYSYWGRHDYVASGNATGPSAFVDNIVDAGAAQSETHGLWSTGILYDNVYSIGVRGSVGVPNYGYLGGTSTDSFGWTGGGIILWNCLASILLATNPPSDYNNFLIGQTGLYTGDNVLDFKKFDIESRVEQFQTGSLKDPLPEHFATSDDTAFVGDAYKESPNNPVEPRSLFKAQLAERLTGNFKNVKPNAPIIESPRGEFEHASQTNEITIDGIFQKGAEKVTIYIDNEPYEATLNVTDNTFTLPVELNNGTHKVYATQTINGVESTKTADRFIVIKKPSVTNPSYLQSEYEYDKIHQTINDDIISFDEYQKPFENMVDETITVTMNGEMVIADVEPVEMYGRVLIPMRAIFEKYGAQISWDEKTATATAVKDEITISITENSTIAKVDGQDYILDVPATIINGRFVVPVRFISESFGSEVGWIDSKKTVVITHTIRSGLKNEIPIVDMVQSADDGGSSKIPNVLDGDPTTSWAVSRDNPLGAWGTFDLGEVKNINSIYIAFKFGTARKYSFDLLVSEDGTNYEMIIEKTSSSGKTDTMERFPLNTKGRYIKIVGYGYDNGHWNNYTEIAVTGN